MKRARMISATGAVLATSAFLVPAGAQTSATIRIATLPADISGEVFYAQEMGFFDKAGLNVEITPLHDGSTIAASALSGAIDIGYTGVFELLNGRERGLAFQMLAPANMHVAAQPTAALVAVLANGPLMTAKDLVGKIIAVNPLRGATYLAARAWLDKNGGDSTKVNFLELPLPTMADAIKAGRVDAALIDALGDPTVGKPGDPLRLLGCAFDAISPAFVPSVFMSSTDWFVKHGSDARKFASAMRETAVWANAHHSESAEILAKYTKLTVAQLQGITRVTYGVDLTPALIQPAIDTAAKYGIIAKSFPAGDILPKFGR
jgi:NitT/TauT family transport system substrate-binding protein